MAQKISETLMQAKALIQDPTHWTKGEMARDGSGRVTLARSARAVSWCAMGAINRINGGHELGASWVLQRALGIGITQFNDNTTHAEVLKAFDKAIALAEQMNL